MRMSMIPLGDFASEELTVPPSLPAKVWAWHDESSSPDAADPVAHKAIFTFDLLR
jgi:hypothetical protein